MRPRPSAFLHLAALLLAGSVAGAQVVESTLPPGDAPAPAPELPRWTAEERAALTLLRELRRKERPPDDAFVVKLSQPGARLVPLMFGVLAERAVPAPDDGPVQVLSELQEKIVLLTLAQLGREVVLGYVERAVGAPPTLGAREAALACIGAVGRANDLPGLFELAFASGETVPVERLEKALTRAVTSIVLHDPKAIEQLVTLRRITRPELLSALVEAVGAARVTHGLAYLSEVAYWHPGLVLDVMSQVSLIGPSGDETVDAALRVRLRAYLDEAQPGPCRAAITALTALHDQDSIAQLIDLLQSESAGLRETAHWALKQLTGLALAPELAVWSKWHQGELYWLVRKKPEAFRHLQETDPATVSVALRSILEHPLARAELVTALPDLLKSRWPQIRVLACRTLADLAAKDSVPKLVWTLEDPVPDVAKAAHAALRKLTRLDLPSEPLAWQAATNTDARAAEL